jgi:uncharacterized protein (DUF486 family)
MPTVALLTVANIFMTFAWYGHLRFRSAPLWQVIAVSWLIAGVEYMFQVPANRIGSQHGWSGYQLKVTQEAITLVVFMLFAWWYLGEAIRWNYLVSFGLILAAVFFTFGFKAR